MTLRSALLLLALTFTLAACERPPSSTDLEADRRREEQIQALDERLAALQETEKQAAQRNLAEAERKAQEFERKAVDTEKRAAELEKRASLSEQDRQRLERERQALLRERERLADAKKKAEQQASEAERKAEDTAQRAAEERQERTMDFFYTALEPHGEWLELGQYGYVWLPNAASNPRWRPYTEGRWVFTEYGWTWKSNEPFGWATYHYGRWTRIRGTGWIWVPGTEWGPGWVSWRRSDRFVGWAPLPPEAWSGSGFNEAVDSYYEIGPTAYTFVPVEEIGQSTYVGHVVEPERNVTIVNQTVNVTNIKYAKVENNTVVYNGGPILAEINARSEQKVPQLKVERVTDIRGSNDLGRAEQKGNTLVMTAPRIAPKKETERPGRVRKEVKTPEIERGWADIDKKSADEARTQITKEARQTEERQRKSAPDREPRATPAQRPPATPVPQEPRKTFAPAAPEVKATPGAIRRRGRDETAGARPEAPMTAPAVRRRQAAEETTRPEAGAPAATPVAKAATPVAPEATPPASQSAPAVEEPATVAPEVSQPTAAGPDEKGMKARKLRRDGEPEPRNREKEAPAEADPRVESEPERRIPKVKRARPGVPSATPSATPTPPASPTPAARATSGVEIAVPPGTASEVEEADTGAEAPAAEIPADERKGKNKEKTPGRSAAKAGE